MNAQLHLNCLLGCVSVAFMFLFYPLVSIERKSSPREGKVMVHLNGIKTAQLLSKVSVKLQNKSIKITTMNTAENDHAQDFSYITDIY